MSNLNALMNLHSSEWQMHIAAFMASAAAYSGSPAAESSLADRQVSIDLLGESYMTTGFAISICHAELKAALPDTASGEAAQRARRAAYALAGGAREALDRSHNIALAARCVATAMRLGIEIPDIADASAPACPYRLVPYLPE